MITLNDGTIVTQADFDEAVQLGVEILDEVWGVGAWREEIDLVKLDMSDNENCVLGQLYMDYDLAPWEEINEVNPGVFAIPSRSSSVGPFELGKIFFPSDACPHEEAWREGYRVFTEAWRKEIHWDADDAFKTAKDM